MNIPLVVALRKNGREKLTALSRRTNIPVTSIFEKIKRTKAIKRFTALLNYSELGYTCLTHTIIKVEKDDKARLQSWLKHHKNVNTLYRINNGYDFIAEGVFKSMFEAECFLEELHSYAIKEEKTHYILEEVAKEEFLMK